MKIIKVTEGRPLKIECPLGPGRHQWFRSCGEQLLDPDTKKRLEVLNFTSVRSTDLGVYYCGARPIDENHSAGFSLTVRKFVLMGNESASLAFFCINVDVILSLKLTQTWL